MTNDELRAYDQKHIWHPYTSMVNPSPVFPVASATGVYLSLESGEKLVEYSVKF